ncbi:Sirtuin 5 and-related class III sirtuin [Ceratobasidium theobromae]|uniref:Sirtuin 5 and-related class III sirtuin n=1 Tax=Ceratobasidium theobromae TaxID=1582974 RepID=A0A5N5QBV6_9AGAM|nr:Sirtuin 5 and-related class III sirtuin [Ceratobasidium theobromae]
MTQTVPLAHLTSAKPSATEASSRKTLNGLALAVAKAKRIVVVTGAGISCSSGIPDFRSSDGLYNLVKSRYPDVVLKGRDLFDAGLFRDPTSAAVFYTFMAELKTQIDSARPAPVHDFLAVLDAKGKLLRSYTQNIDGLEERAGLGSKKAKNVQLHGDIHRVRCTLCSASFSCAPDHIAQFRTGIPPDCPECIARSDARTARSARALKCGTLRPAIVLYDEPHPLGDHIGAVQTSDLGKKPDLLIVMGTSLKVHGLRRLVKSFAKAVHSSRPDPTTAAKSASRSLLHNVLFVNRTPPPPGEWAGVFDYHVEGDADTWVAQVLSEWKRVRPVDWEVQSTLDGAMGNIPKGLGVPGDVKAGKGVKGAKGVAKDLKSKGKSKAGAENMPPEEDQATGSGKPSNRFTIVLPGRRRLGLTKSPLASRTMASPIMVGKGRMRLGLPKAPRPGAPKSPGINTLGEGTGTPARIGIKRAAASPLVSGYPRIDTMFPRSPAAPKAKRMALSAARVIGCAIPTSTAVPKCSPSESADTDAEDFSTPSTSLTPCFGTSASSSQADLVSQEAPTSASSQTSRTSTMDSIFSPQGSQTTQDSSREGSQDESASIVAITGSPKSCSPTLDASAVDSRTQLSGPSRSPRYLGQPRSPPFKSRSVGSGQELFASGSGAVAPGPLTLPYLSISQSLSPAPRRQSSATGRAFGRHVSTGLLPLPERSTADSQPQRRPVRIPIPGKDIGVAPSGERFLLNKGDTSESEEDIPLMSQVSITAPPAPPHPLATLLSPSRRIVSPGFHARIIPQPKPSCSGEGSPMKRGAAGDSDSDVDVLGDGRDLPRGLLFPSKGKEPAVGDMNVDVIDVESDAVASRDDDDDDDDDSMSLDGAVEHMSLDGPAKDAFDTDVDVVGVDSAEDAVMSSIIATQSTVVASPIRTRAGRRAKEAATKRVKRVSRPRVVGTRTSSRLAALTSS